MGRYGFPRAVAMAIRGHKTESVYRRYEIVSPRDINTAKIKMEQYVERSMRQSLHQSHERAEGRLNNFVYIVDMT